MNHKGAVFVMIVGIIVVGVLLALNTYAFIAGLGDPTLAALSVVVGGIGLGWLLGLLFAMVTRRQA